MKTRLFPLSITAAAQTTDPNVPSKPQPCPPAIAGSGTLCATYPVWEDRERRTGRKIALNIMILRAPGPNHATDPIFFLAGGPGQAATSLMLAFAFRKEMPEKLQGGSVRSVVMAGGGASRRIDPVASCLGRQTRHRRIIRRVQCRPGVQSLLSESSAGIRHGAGASNPRREVEIRGPNGKPVTVEPSPPVLTEGVRHYLCSSDGRPLPRMIHQAFEGNLTPLMQLTVHGQLAYGSDFAYGLLLSVTCAELVPFIQKADILKETAVSSAQHDNRGW